MVSPSHKNFHSSHIFSSKSHFLSSPSTLSSTKVKTLLHTVIFSHLCRIARALSKAKSILVHLFKDIHLIQLIVPLKKNQNKKNILGSFRLHYNWGNNSSHVVPISTPVLNGYMYYDASWNSFINEKSGDNLESELSGYLEWLENGGAKSNGGDCVNEIDKLADKFIANSREKFMLEKQESYRMFQEMMARSV